MSIKKCLKILKSILPKNENSPYYILKDFYKDLASSSKLGDSKKELKLPNKIEGTIGDYGTFTYRKLNDNEYQIVSGPIPEKIGKIFKTKYDFSDEQLSKLPKDLNQEKGNMFRGWVNDNKTPKEVAKVLKDIPSTDKTLGTKGSFKNDHFKMAYITYKDEYDKHLKRFDTDNAPAFMGLKKAETGKGINNDYYKFVIDDVAVAIDTEGNILQRPRGGKTKDGKPVSTSYVAENKRIRRVRTRRLNERKLDVSYIVGKIKKGIESGNIKGMKEIPQGLKDIIKKKAGSVKKTSKSTSKSRSKSTSKANRYGSSVIGGPFGSLLDFISSGEGGYNSMNRGTKKITVTGPDGEPKEKNVIVNSSHDSKKTLSKLFGIDKNLTDMTVGEIMKLQSEVGDDGKLKLFAVGRYQIIPLTMKKAVADSGVSKEDLFDPQTQDKLGVALLMGSKRPRLAAYLKGQKYNGNYISIERAALDLAQEWASVPTPI